MRNLHFSSGFLVRDRGCDVQPARIGFPSRLHLAHILFVAVLVAPGTLFAQKTIHVPADQPTIQAGIDASAKGDTVLVAAGTYHENINFKGKAITVTSSGGAAQTIIDGGAKGATVLFTNNEGRDSVLSGFTIENGGNEIDPANTLGDGGIYVGNSAPSILRNIVTSNYCAGIDVEFAAPYVFGNVIRNTLESAGTYCVFAGNGLILGGASSGPYPSPVIIGNTIEDNTHADEYDGGAIEIWAPEGTVIESNIIRNNATPGQGGGIVAFNSDSMFIAGNLFYGNTSGYNGSAISILAPEASQGPFFAIVANNTIASNTTTGQNGNGSVQSQVYLEGNLAQYAFVNNIVVGSNTDVGLYCGTTYNYLSITPLVVDHNDIYNPTGDAYGGACPDQTGIYGNISGNPLFVDPGSNDYHLQKSSPAIDSGNNSVLELLLQTGYGIGSDLDGHPRPVDATGKGYPVADMGAYEFKGTSGQSPTTIVVTPSAWSVNGGVPLTLTAQFYSVAGIPTGTAIFFEDQKQVGTAVIGSDGAAVLQVPGLVPGIHAFVVTYPGQGEFSPAVSVKIYVIVSTYSVTLTLVSNPNPSLVGQTVTFAVTLTTGDGGFAGTVALTDNGTPLTTLTTNANGAATYATSKLAVGSHTINATYAGDSAHQAASASLNQVVIAGYSTTTTLTSSLNPANAGQSVTFTATVTSQNGTPNGSVSFLDGTTHLATATLSNGTASYSTSSLSVGSHTITASYVGGGGFTGSQATLVETINGSASGAVLSCSPTSGPYGTSISCTAKVSASDSTAQPTGSVTFYDGATSLKTIALAGGAATYSSSTFAVGQHPIDAVYSGDADFGPSTSNTVTVTITADATTLTLTGAPNPAYVGQSITFTARAASANGVPTGTIAFYDGGALLGSTALNAGVATLSTSSLTVGTHTIKASYPGDSSHGAQTATMTEVVNSDVATQATLLCTPLQAVFGAAVRCTASVSAASGSPSGTVTFDDGSSQLATVTLAGGSAVYSTSSLAIGTHPIKAVFATAVPYTGSTSNTVTVTIVAEPTTLTLTGAPDPSFIGQSVTFTARAASASGVPTGSVAFYDGGATLGTAALSAGTAALATSTLTVGSHTITARYAGDGVHAAQSATITHIVKAKLATQTVLQCAPLQALVGSKITCSARVTAASASPAGSVDFYDRSTRLATVALSGGVAKYSTTALAIGAHPIKAVFVPAISFAASTSNIVTVTITSDFTLAVTPAKQTVYTGESAAYKVSVTSTTALPAIAFTCSGIPENTKCLLAPTIAANGTSGSVKATLQTTAPKIQNGGLVGGTPPGTYTLTVTGTAHEGSLTVQHSVSFKLVVKSLF